MQSQQRQGFLRHHHESSEGILDFAFSIIVHRWVFACRLLNYHIHILLERGGLPQEQNAFLVLSDKNLVE